jgi:hypothetical protein
VGPRAGRNHIMREMDMEMFEGEKKKAGKENFSVRIV